MPLFDDGIDLNNTLLRLARDKDGGFSPIVPGLGPTGSWTERFVEVFAQRQATGRINYGLYPPKAESVWQIDDFFQGSGRRIERIAPRESYWYTTGVDASFPDKVVLGPEIRTGATVTDFTIRAFFQFPQSGDVNLYALASDAALDGHVIRTTGDPRGSTAPTWADQAEFATAINVSGLDSRRSEVAVFQGTGDTEARVFLAAASGTAFQTAVSPCTTIASNGGSNAASCFAVVGDALWRADYSSNVYKSTNGTNTPTWGSALLVGDPAQPIRNLLAGYDDSEPSVARLYILKNDGLHTINAAGTAYDQHLTPQFQGTPWSTYNGMHFAVGRGHIFFSMEKQLWAYNMRSGSLKHVGAERLDVSTVAFDTRQLVFAHDRLYASYSGAAYIWKAVFTFDQGGEIVNVDWHPFTGATGGAAGAFYAGFNSSGLPYAVFDRGSNSAGYFHLLDKTHDPQADSTYRYAASGSIYLPQFSDLPGENKVFMGVDLLAKKIAAGQTIDVQYKTTDTGSYASMGTWNASTDNDGIRKDWSTAQRARLIDMRLDFATNDATKTPVLNSFELRFAFRVAPKRIWRATLDLTNSLTGDKTVEDLKTDLNTFANSGTLNMTDPEGVTRVILVDQNPYIALDTYVSQGGSTPVQRYLAVVEMIEAASGTTAGTALALAGAVTMQGNLDMANYIITNIGNASTDFDTGGGLTLAGALDSATSLRVPDDGLIIENPADTFRYTITAGAITANRVLNLPVTTATDTVAVLALAQTFTNKTLTSPTINTPAMGADSIDAITEIAAALKSGADLTLVTGTAGTSGDLSQWNVDGDLVDGPTPPTGAIVGTTDIQTLSSKTLTTPTIAATGWTNANHAHLLANSGGAILSVTSIPLPPPAFEATAGTPALSTPGSMPAWAFDDAADEAIRTNLPAPADYSSGWTVRLIYTMASATTGVVRWQVECNSQAEGEAAGSGFTTVVANDTVQATAANVGIVTFDLSALVINQDEYMDLAISRLGSHIDDTATGDAYLRAVNIEYTRTTAG